MLKLLVIKYANIILHILGHSVIKQPLLGGLDTQINASPKDYRVTWLQSRDYDQY